ncbi:YggT family protein [Collinsella vaginalis]|uniref:YggT family protein n=1 Tax=Collinsella vaginalis TaxID=1870987 RepID=UPI000A26BFCB|nr:YggT family protein [Collinsella vaginalis]
MNSYTLIQFVNLLFNFYNILIIVYCLLSWFPRRSQSFLDDLSRALDTIVGPYLNLFRRIIPSFGGIDFSPVVAIIALNVLERIIIGILVG